MTEVLFPEPFYNGNVRTNTEAESSKMRPKTVPASLGASRSAHTNSSHHRPSSGCRRLNEYVQDSVTPKLPGGIYRMPTSHKPHRAKQPRPQSPLEVVSEQPGVRVMKSRTQFVAEVSFAGDRPISAKSNEKMAPPISVEVFQKPATPIVPSLPAVTTSTSAARNKELEEELANDDNEPDNAFQKIAKLRSLLQKEKERALRAERKVFELEEVVKVKDAELAVKDKVIRQMQQQVDDFQFQLGEERLNHKDTKKTYEERLNGLRKAKDQERDAAIKALTVKYEARIAEITVGHGEQITEIKEAHNRIQRKLEEQVEHLENAFDEFRLSFTSEMETKWKKREDEIRKKIQEDSDEKWSTIVTKNTDTYNDELAKLKKKHSEEMEIIKHDHETEVSGLLRKYKDAYSLTDKVARQQQLIDGLHERLRDFENKLEDTSQQLMDKTNEAAELTIRLTSMERDFNTKLEQNAEMWQRRLESYISENADIKRLYAFSVHRQSCDRLERDIEMRDRARKATQLANAKLEYRQNYIEAVLHSRIRTGLPLVPSNPPTEDEERRVRQAQLLRKRAVKLGASAIVEATDLLPPPPGFEREGPRPSLRNQKAKMDDFLVSAAGRPMSAPTTDVETFCVFMVAAAALDGNNGGTSDRSDDRKAPKSAAAGSVL